jgi:putative nucleotidyltransferase with HDIG domain
VPKAIATLSTGARSDPLAVDAVGSESAAAALELVLKARAPGVHASTSMVCELAAKIGHQLGLEAVDDALLNLAVRVRDVGMVPLPDAVVLATKPLSPADWVLVNQHPVIAAELLSALPGLAATAKIVRAHHERWDGGGYPDGLRGNAIPLLSRIIAICDAFVALASDRPYRRGLGADAALEHIARQRGSQFDPRMVDALTIAIAAKGSPGPFPYLATAAPAHSPRLAPRASGSGQPRDMAGVITEFDVIPVFAPAHERLLRAAAPDSPAGGELVEAIESDAGLTIAILRQAQTIATRHPIANVPDAVTALTAGGVQQAIDLLPLAPFPWRTTPLQVLLHHLRLHAQAVARAADRIVREVSPDQRDDVLVAALLHDIGKLVLSRIVPRYAAMDRIGSPEERVRQEQRSLGMDHASTGGLMVSRWKLPRTLANNVAAHHRSEDEGSVATYVRLADMVAHHSQGDAVDRNKMVRLANACGLSANALRDVMFDLPRPSGSQRRRAEPSPLTSRETDVLRTLAEGKVYKRIALDLGLSTSTVRTHLHHAYRKLNVVDRTQAVLRATEMGWL